MTRFYPLGEINAPAAEGDRAWMLGAVDQVFTGRVWTLWCEPYGLPLLARDGHDRLCCGVCGRNGHQVPVRTKAPGVPS